MQRKVKEQEFRSRRETKSQTGGKLHATDPKPR